MRAGGVALAAVLSFYSEPAILFAGLWPCSSQNQFVPEPVRLGVFVLSDCKYVPKYAASLTIIIKDQKR